MEKTLEGRITQRQKQIILLYFCAWNCHMGMVGSEYTAVVPFVHLCCIVGVFGIGYMEFCYFRQIEKR